MEVKTLVLGPIETNCYIVKDDRGNAAIIDPGFYGDQVIEEAENFGVKHADILLTHGHFDHIGGVKEVKDRFGSKVYIHMEDAEMLTKPMVAGQLMHIPAQDSADMLLSGGEEIHIGDLRFQVIATPGHTRGGVSYLCGDALFTGDTLFCEDIGRTDLEGGSFRTLLESLAVLGEIDEEKTVYPGHAESSTLSHEKEHNLYMKRAK